MIVSENDAERAFHYLRETEERHAQATADFHALKKHENSLIAKLKLASGEKTSAAKEDEAYANWEYEMWEAGMKAANYELTLLENKRDRAKITLDLFRTVQATSRALHKA